MKWVQGGSFIKPLKVDDTISKKYVYIRKDITRTSIEIDGETIPYYTYQETLIKKDEYYPVAACTLETQEQTQENTIDIENTEDAVCELSEVMDEAIAALEQALCDLSEEIGEGVE